MALSMTFPDGYSAASAEEQAAGLRLVIYGYTAATAAAGVLVWFTIPDRMPSRGGFVIEFTCNKPAPVVTTTTTVTVEGTVVEATPVPSTTTAPDPLGPTVVTTPTSITVGPATTAPPPAGPTDTLPVTGTSTTYLVASTGFALLGAGVALLALVQLAASRVRLNKARVE